MLSTAAKSTSLKIVDYNRKLAVDDQSKFTVKRVFTTVNGQWTVTRNSFSIDEESKNLLLKHSSRLKQDHHIVHVLVDDDYNLLDESVDVLYWKGNERKVYSKEQEFIVRQLDDGISSFSIFSDYDPNKEVGKWSTTIEGGSEIITQLGTPYGWNVSTVIVWGIKKDTTRSGLVDYESIPLFSSDWSNLDFENVDLSGVKLNDEMHKYALELLTTLKNIKNSSQRAAAELQKLINAYNAKGK